MIAEVTNHLWQSTVCALVAGLLAAALRKNRAPVRYGLWLSASLKFLVPFSLLMSVGSQLNWAPTPGSLAAQLATPTISYAMEQITQPFPAVFPAAPSVPSTLSWTAADWVPLVLLVVWACGFGTITLLRLQTWRRIRAAVRASTPLNISEVGIGPRLRVRTCPGLLEPSVVGLLQPILLLPTGITKRLTSHQLKAVLAHELCHVQRRDNLTAAIHMVVEAVFWFHPLVWWIGTKLVEERERACDEEVLRLGNEPEAYAEGILNVCKFYKESPLVCMSGVAGSNLRNRVEEIMRNRVTRRLSLSRIVLLAVVAIATLAGPIAIGLVNAAARAHSAPAFRAAPTVQQEAAPQVAGPALNSVEERVAFDVVSIRPSVDPRVGRSDGVTPAGDPPVVVRNARVECAGGYPQVDPKRFAIGNTNLYRLILLAYSNTPVNCAFALDMGLVSGGPDWTRASAGPDRFEIEAVIPAGSPSYTPAELMNGNAPALQAMLRTLLAERFQLRLHRETKQTRVYNLVVDKPGQIRLSDDQSPPAPQTGVFRPGATPRGVITATYLGLTGTAISISALANWAQGVVGRPVSDRTDLEGLFDVQVQLSGFATAGEDFAPGAETTFAFQVLKELGLKLEESTGTVDVFVIDHAEKPSEN